MTNIVLAAASLSRGIAAHFGRQPPAVELVEKGSTSCKRTGPYDVIICQHTVRETSGTVRVRPRRPYFRSFTNIATRLTLFPRAPLTPWCEAPWKACPSISGTTEAIFLKYKTNGVEKNSPIRSRAVCRSACRRLRPDHGA